jgi:hypothetical protein
MKHLNQTQFICLVIALFSLQVAYAQDRVITTAVPFLTISPDSRSGALGDAGVALSPDANSTYWNPAKLPFAKDGFGASYTYTPWLRTLIGDMSINNLSAYGKLKNKTQAVGGYFTYFNAGGITFTDQSGHPIRDFKPNEFTIAGIFSQKLSDNMGLSVTLRFINSNLAGTTFLPQIAETTRPGRTASGDIAWYYNKNIKVDGKPFNLAFGANISNIGAKITYSSNGRREFIPTNLKVGTAITYEADAYSKLTWALDFNKLMVPTPNPNKSSSDIPYLTGIFQSFSDAPGGLQEELQEVIINTGLEYWYNNAFSARAGFFSEAANKGDRKYITLGAGFRTKYIGFDAAYLVSLKRQSALDGSLRFSLLFNLNSFKNQSQEVTEEGGN